jgi:hypothetical protein
MKGFLALLLGAALLQGCRSDPTGSLSPQNPLLTPTPAPPIFASNYFEDFETTAPLPNPWTYGDGGNGASASFSVVPAAAYAGAYGLRANIVAAGWGAGLGFDSRAGARNFSGATVMRVWIRSSASISNFQMSFNESGTGVNAEVWVSPSQSAPAGAWTEFVLPLSAFTEDPYGTAPCNSGGTCANAGVGDGAMQLGAVKSVQFKVNAAGSATVDLDEVRFE